MKVGNVFSLLLGKHRKEPKMNVTWNKEEAEKLDPVEQLNDFLNMLNHRKFFTNDSLIMSGDLDVLKNIVNQINLKCRGEVE
jgi:hypothetical protein